MQVELSRTWLSALFLTTAVIVSTLTATVCAEDVDDKVDSVDTVNEFVEALENFDEKIFEESDLRMTIKLIPDVYLYELGREYRRCVRARYDMYKTTKEIKKAAKKRKKLKGKPSFQISMEVTGAKKHMFLEKSLEKMVILKLPKKKTAAISSKKGDLRYSKWSLDMAEGAYQKRTLGYFRKCSFVLMPKPKVRNKDNDAFEVGIANLVVYTQPERDRIWDYGSYGINADRKELKVDDFKGLPRISPKFSFFPAEWELPTTPPGLQTILDEIDGKKKK